MAHPDCGDERNIDALSPTNAENAYTSEADSAVVMRTPLVAALRALHYETTWTWRDDEGYPGSKKGCSECGADRPPSAITWPCQTVLLIDALAPYEEQANG